MKSMILVFITTFLVMIAARATQGADSYVVWWVVFLPYFAMCRASLLKERVEHYAYVFGGAVLFYLFFHITHFDKFLISGGPMVIDWLSQTWLNRITIAIVTISVLVEMAAETIGDIKE